MKMFIGLFIFFVPLIAGVSLMESNYVWTGGMVMSGRKSGLAYLSSLLPGVDR